MKEFDGRRFAETIFSEDWKSYLSGYGIESAPDEWLFRTISQAYDGFAGEDRQMLLSSLIKQEHATQILQKETAHKRYLFLFDEIIEPFFLQKLSVFTAREIFGNYIAIQKERRELFASSKSVEALSGSDGIRDEREDTYNNILFSSDEIYNENVRIDKPEDINRSEDDSIIDVSREEQAINFNEDVLGVTSNEVNVTPLYDESWKLGNKYKNKLGLNDSEVDWLNKFWDPSNSFLSVEGCCIAVIRLYLLCLKEIIIRFTNNQNDFFEQVKKFISQNQSKRALYLSIEQFREYAESHIYNTFFKRAESAVREAYKHKRKIKADFTFGELSGSFERRFGIIWNEIVSLNKSNISLPDIETELRLNEMNVNRWKLFYDEITADISDANFEHCALKLDELAKENPNNPALENIYYDASKLFIKQDRLTAVKFYLKYIHADINSDKVDNRQLGKTVQKNLFSTEEQLRGFETIVNDLIKTNDLASALSKAPDIYAKKRKRIQLDIASIEQVKTQHQNTVGKLNELLQDEDEGFNEKSDIATGEIELKLIQPIIEHITISTNSFVVGIQLNEHQKGLLILFEENNFQLEENLLSSYAKIKSLFKNQLIESINDCCYEELDDVLIEETGEGYEVNEFYYHKIINLC